mmetsp:Transcript_132549/g.412122  ORF Transcript_132549/g.412122 Transcript_132549/m.412122 type:complete len:145 (+) Transcript_132549:62-496(+)
MAASAPVAVAALALLAVAANALSNLESQAALAHSEKSLAAHGSAGLAAGGEVAAAASRSAAAQAVARPNGPLLMNRTVMDIAALPTGSKYTSNVSFTADWQTEYASVNLTLNTPLGQQQPGGAFRGARPVAVAVAALVASLALF